MRNKSERRFGTHLGNATPVATRVNGVWTFFVYDAGGKMIAEYGGRETADEGGVKYVLSDWQGSTRATIGNSGYVQSRSDYTAFGEQVNSGTGLRTQNQGFIPENNLAQKYSLTERDKATGLDHTWFRKNESQAGRWTSPDPYNGSASISDPQSWNRYAYVANDPINFVDPSGLNKEGGFGSACTTSDGKAGLIDHDGKCKKTNVGASVTVSAGGGGPLGTSGPIIGWWTPIPYNPMPTTSGGGIDDRELLGLSLIGHLAQISDICADALRTLNLSTKKILDAFDKASFVKDPARPLWNARTDLFVGGKIRTRNGLSDFINASSLGWLLHELAHASSKLDDAPMYTALKGAGINVPAITSTTVVKEKVVTAIDFSKSLSDFFNTHCK